ncbi:LysR family transcriptional regulator [Caulobacter sp. KR2-114]|uniref:LysR family transcriptional regulator n=1 Tax=Caulobacter sp. KR2-114 TaxID=3400912 RepID=UPI003C117269
MAPGLDLDDLALFAAVAHRQSFRQAARSLGISPSSLSERIAGLEQRLGLRLLNRTTRSVRPTEAGAVLLERLGPALDGIAEAVEVARQLGDTVAGVLRINVPAPAAHFAILPRLPQFLAAHPRLTLELVVEDSFVDIVERGFDAGVRFGESLARDMIAVPIGAPLRFGLAASPALLARCGRPAHPRDLLGLPCIRHRFLSGAPADWEFEKDGEVVTIRPEGPLIGTDILTQVTAAIEGVGFWHSFEGYMAEAVAEGRLVRLLEDWHPPFPGPFLYYPSRRHMPAGLRAFIDFFRLRA